jgi:hypothetical protein
VNEPVDADLRRFLLGMTELAVVGVVIGAALLWGGAPQAGEATTTTSAQLSIAR